MGHARLASTAPGAPGAHARGTTAPKNERARDKPSEVPTALGWMEEMPRGPVRLASAAPGATGAYARATTVTRSERVRDKPSEEPTALPWMEATAHEPAK